MWMCVQKSSKFEFWLLANSWNHLSFVQCQSYISNGYVNGNGLHEYVYHGRLQNSNLKKKSLKFEIWLLTKCWNHITFVKYQGYISNWQLLMERSSRVLEHGSPKIWIFIEESHCRLEMLTCRRMSWNHLRFVNICSFISNWCLTGKRQFTMLLTVHGKRHICFCSSKKFEIELYFALVLKSLDQQYQ